MIRIPEEELMNDIAQAQAYAQADFEEPHNNFIRLFQEMFGSSLNVRLVLDLGCGPGDITFRFARAYPSCSVHGIDGSDTMLAFGRKALAGAPDVQDRILFISGLLPDIELPGSRYDCIISNSLLHHLPDPLILWETVKCFAAPEAPVCIMDLKRPKSIDEARELTETYAGEEPEILKRDFYNSLCAAFEASEIEKQLRKTGLKNLSVREVSDRHVLITGFIKT